MQAYTQILRGMEKKLAENETQKELVEKELVEVRQSYMAFMK